MKFLPLIFLGVAVAIAGVLIPKNMPQNASVINDYLRIHIEANSNDVEDQILKFEVKNKIVDFLIPYLSDCKNKDDAICVVKENISIIKEIVNSVLVNNNKEYAYVCELKKEQFPARYYESFLLDGGEYDSINITLGEGKGDNWWCVVFPPLCFVNKNVTNEQDIVYRSRLLELIKDFFK